eukprot:CAMPEP_0202692698 /NCGR_PEP_ID=MMETSP1385-20130828/7016_1 /ASSEMBLY_ACC=CAM_ASM_000861 /TAXON_ID=933848 /ORGANISM="Elphidium margaritaceum" /LENGTH=320 /DNA_ID=CAMNT_0049348277 /DNA_START=31 /DNA_END=993 /DNA_ORIENTATION=+
MAAQTSTPSPFKILLELYQQDHAKPLRVEGLFEIELKLQIAVLDPQQCDTKQRRSDIVRRLNCKELDENVAKRIRFKCILAEYHTHFSLVNTANSKQIALWNTEDCILSIVCFCIQNESVFADKKLRATWDFLQYLKEYFFECNIDGSTLIARYLDEQTSLGLSVVKAVCKHFGVMSGKYAHVKKHLLEWWKTIRVRYTQLQKENAPSPPTIAPAHDDTDGVHNSSHRWYWLCDDDGNIRWIPYQQEDQRVIIQAWNERTETCVIVMNKYRIDFSRECTEIPCGQQYNCQLTCPSQREVVFGQPDSKGWLNGIFCESMSK